MSRARARAASLLLPKNLGVCVRCGVDAIVHAIRHRVRRHGHHGLLALLQLDFRNSFHLVNREAMLRAVRTHLSELEPYYRLVYINTEDPHLWCGELRMRSAVGVQQGDPLWPLFFSLALHDLLSFMPRAPADEVDSDDNASAAHRAMFYIEDGVVVGPHATLQNFLTFLGSTAAAAHGVQLRAEKCSI